MVNYTSYFVSALINSNLKFMPGIQVRLIFLKQVGSSIHSAKNNCFCFDLRDKICSFTDSYSLLSPVNDKAEVCFFFFIVNIILQIVEKQHI